jgi:dTDP-4-dehydrorhamnose 3,5-epimerase
VEFIETPLEGAYLVRLQKREDQRGFFARGWCQREFSDAGLNGNMVQLNVGLSLTGGTLRGMHYQAAPDAEVKLVRCVRGSLFDVIIDLRTDSPTRGKWFGAELSAGNGLMLYAPEGFAHGYQTLVDDTEMYYMTSAFYVPTAARGVRHDDPAFGIAWPRPVSVISDADRQWPDYVP